MKNLKKIEITGSSGFVGTHVSEFLNSSYQVEKKSIRYRLNQKFEINSDAIIHLAGKAHDLKKVSQPQDYYEANFELTKQLFDSFINSNASVFIFISSVKAVADQIENTLTETTPPNPKTHYGISKLMAEKYISNIKLKKEKRVYILRPTMIHGPGNKGNLNSLYSIVKKGYPWPLAAFENKRSFLSIDNLSFVISELLENVSIPSGIYNVADNEVISTNQLINLIAKSLNKRSLSFKVPKFIIAPLSKLGDIFNLPLNSERLQKLTENYIVSNKKLINAISKPLPLSTEKGFVITLNSFKNVK